MSRLAVGKRILGPALAAVLGALAYLIFLPSIAHAIPGNSFPAPFNTDPQPNNAFAIVTNGDGAAVTLHAPLSQFKVFFPADLQGVHNIYIDWACGNPGNDYYDTNIVASVARPDWNDGWVPGEAKDNTSGCAGGAIVFPIDVQGVGKQPNYYGDQFRVVLVNVQKTGGVGIKNFRVNVDNGQVTFAEADRRSTANPGQQGPVFSLWDGVDPGYYSERAYRFRFRVDCKFRSLMGQSHFWLKWYDADWQRHNELGDNIYFELRNETTGQVHTIGGPGIGGEGEFREVPVPIFSDNDQFTWTWYNVDRVNGIQIYMPFSEMQDQVSQDCAWANPDKPATSWLENADCDPIAQTSRIKGWGYDPDRPDDSVEIHLYFDGFGPQNFGGAFRTDKLRPDVNAAFGIGGLHGFEIPIPQKYIDIAPHTVYAFVIGLKRDGSPSGQNPQLNGSGIVFGPCAPPVPFKLVPIAQPPQASPDEEDPNSIVFRTSINPAAPTPAEGVNARSTRTFFWRRGGVVMGPLTPSLSTPNPHDSRFLPVNYTDTLSFNPRDYQAGDEFCVRIRIEPAEGLVFRHNSQVHGAPTVPFAETDGNACYRFANRPYLKAYGADVRAGGTFANPANNCPTSNATIRTFARRVAGSGSDHGYRGSSAELAAFAMDVIQGDSPYGFFSAALRRDQPLPPRGLTFANTIAPPQWGGGFGTTANCMTDFFADTMTDAVVPAVGNRINVGSFTGQRLAAVAPGGRVVLEGSANMTGSRTLYVTGDVFIENNLTYRSNGWNDTKDIPFLAVIVRGGNIYVSNTVTQLDGLFIAQPEDPLNPAGSGEIFTCVRPNGQRFDPAADRGEYFKPPGAGCNAQLRVNGSLTAQRVRFLRTNNSLRDAVAEERSIGSRAAEIITMGPEVFLAEAAFRDPGVNESAVTPRSTYDSIVSLPPVY